MSKDFFSDSPPFHSHDVFYVDVDFIIVIIYFSKLKKKKRSVICQSISLNAM
jgi:hypothetical protein